MERGVICFGGFELDVANYELRRSGRIIKLERQPMELLILLTENGGRLVKRDEIICRLWGANTVLDTDQSINSSIRKIRSALRDDSDHPKFIATVVGKGYRFIAPLKTDLATRLSQSIVDDPRPASAPATGDIPNTPSVAEQRNPRVLLMSSIAMFVAVCIGIWLFYQLANPAAPGIHSIAVLPLSNLSADKEQEYFSEGMTDAIITDLAQASGLRVISHTTTNTYEHTKKSLGEIARELRVEAIVEGTVVRSHNRVRVTAQLIRTMDDRHLWADSYEGDLGDILWLQNQVASDIALKVKARLAPTRMEKVRPVQPRSYEAYLRGLYFFDRRYAEKSAECFRQALAIDSGYAPAYAGLAQALASESVMGIASPYEVMPPAREAARHALEIDPRSSEAYTALGHIGIVFDWDWKAAERNLRRAIDLSPNYSLAEVFYGFYFGCLGNHDEAVTHTRRALELDPLSFFCNRMYGSALYMARRYDESLLQLRRTEELHDLPGVIENWISWIDEQQRNYDGAVNADLRSLEGEPVTDLALFRQAYAGGGWKRYWRARLNRDLLHASEQCVPFDLSLDYLRLDNSEEAFRWLSRAVDQRCVWVAWLRSDPKLDPLRSDARFQKFLAQMNLKSHLGRP